MTAEPGCAAWQPPLAAAAAAVPAGCLLATAATPPGPFASYVALTKHAAKETKPRTKLPRKITWMVSLQGALPLLPPLPPSPAAAAARAASDSAPSCRHSALQVSPSRAQRHAAPPHQERSTPSRLPPWQRALAAAAAPAAAAGCSWPPPKHPPPSGGDLSVNRKIINRAASWSAAAAAAEGAADGRCAGHAACAAAGRCTAASRQPQARSQPSLHPTQHPAPRFPVSHHPPDHKSAPPLLAPPGRRRRGAACCRRALRLLGVLRIKPVVQLWQRRRERND